MICCLIIFGFFSFKAINVVMFSGFAFLPLVLTRVTFRFEFDFRPLRWLRQCSLLQSNDDMKQLLYQIALIDCSAACVVMCWICSLWWYMTINQIGNAGWLTRWYLSPVEASWNIVCAWSCRCSSYFEHTTTTPWQSWNLLTVNHADTTVDRLWGIKTGLPANLRVLHK